MEDSMSLFKNLCYPIWTHIKNEKDSNKFNLDLNEEKGKRLWVYKTHR